MQRYYTTVEQSKKLLKLGLDVKTHDMFYEQEIGRNTDMPYYAVKVGSSIAIEQNLFSYRNELVIPCWSVGALLDVLDYPKFYKDNTSGKDLWHCCCNINEREIIKASFAETEIDAVVELVTHLLEFGILKNKRNDESR